MEYGSIPGVDLPVSRVIQGCTGISRRELDLALDLLDGVFELGCTACDTAVIYGGGQSERALGEWVSRRGVRKKVVLVTKGAHHNQDRKRVTPFDIASDLHDSLARLKTDYIDVYLLHRDDPDVPVGEIVEALNEHASSGKIRAFGGSNWTGDRIRQANDYARDHGLTGFVVSSPNLSLAVSADVPWGGCVSISAPEGRADRQWYAETQMPVLAWSSLAGGFLTGRFTRENVHTFTEGMDATLVRCYGTEENFRRLDWAKRIAADSGASVAQVAVAWLFRQPLNVFALTACDTKQEMAANIEALKLPLGDDCPD